eukprot:TRINITY_DN67241_c0_g1_i2.p1 TRINITY_DN67241_c0_g1~~TRINITY_DN67241_c0_g1_i2.p1  ORF type:complete len:198 (-),score=-4.12 TRINITY_DN67241_c0_g1_i2:364-957(-)
MRESVRAKQHIDSRGEKHPLFACSLWGDCPTVVPASFYKEVGPQGQNLGVQKSLDGQQPFAQVRAQNNERHNTMQLRQKCSLCTGLSLVQRKNQQVDTGTKSVQAGPPWVYFHCKAIKQQKTEICSLKIFGPQYARNARRKVQNGEIVKAGNMPNVYPIGSTSGNLSGTSCIRLVCLLNLLFKRLQDESISIRYSFV